MFGGTANYNTLIWCECDFFFVCVWCKPSNRIKRIKKNKSEIMHIFNWCQHHFLLLLFSSLKRRRGQLSYTHAHTLNYANEFRFVKMRLGAKIDLRAILKGKKKYVYDIVARLTYLYIICLLSQWVSDWMCLFKCVLVRFQSNKFASMRSHTNKHNSRTKP